MNPRKNFVSALASMVFGIGAIDSMRTLADTEQRPLNHIRTKEEHPKKGQKVFNIEGQRIVALNYKNALRKAGKL